MNLTTKYMNENSFFDINRFKFLLFRQIRFSTQTLLIGFGAVSGLIVFILSLKAIFGQSVLNQTSFFGLIMPFFFAGGLVFTSTIFSELRSSHRGYLYLTLPASTFEKLIVSWLISTFIYIVASVVVIYAINLLLMGVYVAFSGVAAPLFNIFNSAVLKAFAVYLVIQPIFMLGAIYFRGVNFLKTLLALFVIILIIVFYSSLAGRLIIAHNFSTMHFDGDISDSVKNFFENTFVPVIKVVFWYCLAPFFLVVSYFRLKEREV
jgi:hypothetical protein